MARAVLTQASFARLRSGVLIDAAFYAVPSLLASLLPGVSTALVARGLSTHAFGNFSFAVSFLLLSALFFDFGMALPAGRLAAKGDRAQSRQVVGGYLLVFVPIGLTFSLLT